MLFFIVFVPVISVANAARDSKDSKGLPRKKDSFRVIKLKITTCIKQNEIIS
jgi:hypothetical protein